jgi:hypothetical protein
MTLQKNEPGRKRDTLSNLHRFADPQHNRDDGANEATTIFGKVIDAAHAEFNRAAVQRPPAENSRLKIEAMLGVVSYCYTKGVFSSVEIEERLWHDPAFLSTFGSETPTAAKIRAFRREHRENLVATIERALQDFCLPGSSQSLNAPPKLICMTAGTRDWARRKAQELMEMGRFADTIDAE